MLERLDAFKRRRPDIPITPRYASRTGKWEAAEPGQQPRPYPNGTQMMDHLETRYPPSR